MLRLRPKMKVKKKKRRSLHCDGYRQQGINGSGMLINITGSIKRFHHKIKSQIFSTGRANFFELNMASRI